MGRPTPAIGFSVALLFTGAALGDPAASLKFEKLLAFAGQDHVRIEAALQAGPETGLVEFVGEIKPIAGRQILWRGSLGGREAKTNTVISLTHTVSDLNPNLWEPTSPALYKLDVTAISGGNILATKSIRFGFRSFEIHGGQFHLNGRPIFLRGIAINPPGRTIPPAAGESRAFAEAYVRYLKSQNVNCFRIATDELQVWFDVCDELGMLLYAGRYGSPPGTATGKSVAPKDHDKIITAYKQLFEKYASHPSIVMYLLANELPVSGERGAEFRKLLTQAHEELKRWDDTRPFIGNAGYGEGREGDVCDVHRYWGWYYNSFLTYYNLRDKLYAQPLFGDPAKNQPLTFTECVGSFTGSSGEFNIVRSKQLGAQLGWTGHSADQREDALRYQSFMVKQATESFRRMRPLNPRLAGLMPFTILFYNWSGITAFDEMKPKPAMEQMGISYQPVLLSWEVWTPQVYAGTKVRAIAHVINDNDQGLSLTNALLSVRIRARDGHEFCRGEKTLPTVPYFGTWTATVDLKLPGELASGEYLISGNIVSAQHIVSTNSTELFVAGSDWKKSAGRSGSTVHLYDPSGKTAAAFTKVGIKFTRLSDLASWPNKMSALVIGERSWDKSLAARTPQLQRFISNGGRVLCLQPNPQNFDTAWLPAEISFFTSSPNDTDYQPRSRPFREQMNANPERPDHPVFAGLDRHRLALWSDYTAWDQTKPGFPKLYPVTAGFKLNQPAAQERTAILADYDRGLEGIALCEMFDGKGSVILSGFDLVNRAGLDPAADRLLANLVAYTASKEKHYIHPLIEQPIRWGNYVTEKGTVCGSLNDLLVNAEWIAPPTNPSAKPLAPNTGSWNMMPGDQFVPRGRNPFGAYTYSTGTGLRDLDRESPTGSGVFWARIPAGKKVVVTKVKNPTATEAELTVAINGKSSGKATRIPPAGVVTLHTPLETAATEVSVRYTGEKTLVLLETAFE